MRLQIGDYEFIYIQETYDKIVKKILSMKAKTRMIFVDID